MKSTLINLDDLDKPIKRTFTEKCSYWCWRFSRFLSDVKWFVLHRLHPKHRYHRIDTGLKPGYYDPDVRLVAAIFNITAEFVENTADTIGWEHDLMHKSAWVLLNQANDWWKTNKKALLEEGFGLARDENIIEERDYHLKNIITVLDFMWYP